MLPHIQKRIILASGILSAMIGCVLFYDFLSTEFVYNYGPDWAPSGEKLTFVCYQPTLLDMIVALLGDENFSDIPYPPQSSEICIMAADQKDQLRLTNNRDPDDSPKWSPDGDKIAFLSKRGFNTYLRLVDLNGELRDILENTEEGLGGDFEWSPDGKEIVYSVYSSMKVEDAGLFILDIDSGKTRQIYSGNESQNPSWSTDHKHLAFTYGAGNTCETHIIDIESEKEIVTPLTSMCHNSAVWSPDGTNIAIVGPQANTIVVFDVNNQLLRVVLEGFDNIDNLIWSSTGDSIFGLIGGHPFRTRT